jgi:hypothetical protein
VSCKGILDFHSTDPTAGFEVFGEERGQTIELRICPHVSVEPGQAVRSTTTYRKPEYFLGRINHRILVQETLGLQKSLFPRKNRGASADWTGYGCYKFHDRLMSNTQLILFEAEAKKSGGTPTFLRKPPVKTVYKNVSVYESGHIVSADHYTNRPVAIHASLQLWPTSWEAAGQSV